MILRIGLVATFQNSIQFCDEIYSVCLSARSFRIAVFTTGYRGSLRKIKRNRTLVSIRYTTFKDAPRKYPHDSLHNLIMEVHLTQHKLQNHQLIGQQVSQIHHHEF